MTHFLALEPLEFLLRYNVLAGMVVAIIGTAICMMAKRIAMAKKGQVEIDRNDSTYTKLKFLGLALIIIGMILIALPFEATLYRG
jgi:xanthine/uracil permease